MTSFVDSDEETEDAFSERVIGHYDYRHSRQVTTKILNFADSLFIHSIMILTF